MQTLKETFREEIERALTEDEGYELVSEPGPNVLRLDAFLIDLIVRFDQEAKSVLSQASPPIGS